MNMMLPTKQVQTPFPREILRFLLKHEKHIANKVVRDFTTGYVKWLYQCADQESEFLAGAITKLVRWTTPEGGSYGFRPFDVAFYVGQLNEFFYTVMAYAYLRNSGQLDKDEKVLAQGFNLSEEMLQGFSCCLGFYILSCYFTTESPQKNAKQEKSWFSRLCQLSSDLTDLETWRPPEHIEKSELVDNILSSPQSQLEAYYHPALHANDANTTPRPQYEQAPSQNYQANKGYYNSEQIAQIYNQGYDNGHQKGYQTGYPLGYKQAQKERERRRISTSHVICEEERKRLVGFIKVLRQTLSVLESNPAVFDDSLWEEITNNTTE